MMRKKRASGDPSLLTGDRQPVRQGLLAEISDTGFVGMWKDRPDIKDSSEFARQLRERSQAPVDSDSDPEDK